MNNNYQPGDQLEWWRWPDGKWLSLGRHLGTTSTGHVVYEDEYGEPDWLASHTASRRAPDMITVTVEISRKAAAEVVAYGNPVAGRTAARREGFQAFIDAVREAVES